MVLMPEITPEPPGAWVGIWVGAGAGAGGVCAPANELGMSAAANNPHREISVKRMRRNQCLPRQSLPYGDCSWLAAGFFRLRYAPRKR